MGEEIDSHPERISKLKKFEKDFDWFGIKFPVSVKDIKGFESKNRISINLLAVEGKGSTFVEREEITIAQ